MNILIVHRSFPAQYKHIARALGENPEHRVVFVSESQHSTAIPGIQRANIHITNDLNKLSLQEQFVTRGKMYLRVLQDIRDSENFRPDVICVHSFGGVELFIKDVYPDVPVLSYLEWFVRPDIDEVNYYPPRRLSDEHRANSRVVANFKLAQCVWSDWLVTPTYWQFSRYPKIFRSRFSVLHDGIDTEVIDPQHFDDSPFEIADGVRIDPSDRLVTYIARDLDPVRGFPQMMHAVERVLRADSSCKVVIVGGDGKGYGRIRPSLATWRKQLLSEVKLDRDRVRLCGRVPYEEFLRLLAASTVHIYLTTGFVASWSLLEAMAMGCAIVGSRTPPVQELIRDGENGLLVDFNSPDDIAAGVLRLLADPGTRTRLGEAARDTIVRAYSLKEILPLQLELIRDVAQGKSPPPAAAKIDQRNRDLGLKSYLDIPGN